MKRINIDLKRGRYDDGAGATRLDSITDTIITIKSSSPFLLQGGSLGMGPIVSSLVLDRTSLVLTDQLLVPDRNIRRITHYQCVMSGPIDFTVGRRF